MKLQTYHTTDYLISRRMKQPGHLRSSYPLRNFSERKEGCQKALRDNGMSASLSTVHECGYRIPEDIAIIGFDNISEGRIIDPSLTSVSIPRLYMAQLAVKN